MAIMISPLNKVCDDIDVPQERRPEFKTTFLVSFMDRSELQSLPYGSCKNRQAGERGDCFPALRG
ncbi:MAG: hypothetical protein ACK4UX_08430 [Thiobacillus sp.]